MDTLHNTREEHKKSFLEWTGGVTNVVIDKTMDWSADWWLAKMESYGNAIREEIREKINKWKTKTDEGSEEVDRLFTHLFKE